MSRATFTQSGQRSTREQILDTASELFVLNGFRAVGIDTIIARSGVAKMTLYRHFPSKDALIAAYLERSNAFFLEWFDRAVSYGETPRDQLIALFEGLSVLTNQSSCYGCSFQTAAAEFPDRDHPSHQAALTHKRQIIARLALLGQRAGARNPHVLAEQLLLLMDGALVAARVFGPANHARNVAAAARTLIDVQFTQ